MTVIAKGTEFAYNLLDIDSFCYEVVGGKVLLRWYKYRLGDQLYLVTAKGILKGKLPVEVDG